MFETTTATDHPSTWGDAWKRTRTRSWFDGFFDPLAEVALDFLGPILRPRGSLLHLGSSDGDKTAALRRLGFDARGIEINPASIATARARHPDTPFVEGDVLALPFEDASFDAVFSFSVLQCVDWRKAIAEARRVLKPNGRAVFIENLEASPFARAFRALHVYAGWRYPEYQEPRDYLDWRDLPELVRGFSSARYSAHHLTTPAVLALPAIRSRVLNVPLRIRNEGALSLLGAVDRALLDRVPPLRRYAWKAVICLAA